MDTTPSNILTKSRGFLGEFKAFASRSNFIDVAVGITLATAFGRITSALVDQVFMPLLTSLYHSDFSSWDIVLREAVLEGGMVVNPPVVLGLGTLLGAIINFILIAFVMFLFVRAINRMRDAADRLTKKEAPEEAAAPAAPEDILLLTEIRDLLKQSNPPASDE